MVLFWQLWTFIFLLNKRFRPNDLRIIIEDIEYYNMTLDIQNFKIQPWGWNFWVTKISIIINMTHDIRVSWRNNHQNMVNTSFQDDCQWKNQGLSFQVWPSLSQLLLKNAKNFDLKMIWKIIKKNFAPKNHFFFKKCSFTNHLQ